MTPTAPVGPDGTEKAAPPVEESGGAMPGGSWLSLSWMGSTVGGGVGVGTGVAVPAGVGDAVGGAVPPPSVMYTGLASSWNSGRPVESLPELLKESPRLSTAVDPIGALT